MQRLICTGVVLAAATLLADSAVGQPPRGGRRGGGNPAVLLANKSVQTELKITPEQSEKLKEFAQKMRDKTAELQSKEGDELRDARQALAKEAGDFIKATLDEKQNVRFKQIRLQQSGIMAFNDKEVVEALKLTDEQKVKIKGVSDESREKMRGLREMEAEEREKKRAEITKELMAKAAEVLTADQKKTWTDLIGKPFEIKFDRPAA